MSINFPEGQKEAKIRENDFEIRITIEDAKQILSLLLKALKTSQIGDRAQLIALTEVLPAWIDSDGRVMVGGWLLQLRKHQLVATYRLSENETQAVGYAASIIKDDKRWRITKIVPEKIRFRR